MKILFTIIIILFFYNISSGQWVLQNTGTGFDISDISFPNAQTGYICGYGNMFYKTTNGGTSWANLSFPGTASNFDAVYFFTGQSGLLASTNDTIYKTSNGGVNWYNKFFIGYPVQNFQFFDSLSGYACGINRLSYTSNGGVNWTTSNINSNGALFFLNKNTGWTVNYIGSGISEILKTSNGGLNWTSQYTSVNFRNLYAVFFIDQNTGWASGYRHTIIKTTDGGQNWVTQNDQASASGLYSICFINPNTGWTVGDYYSANGASSYYTTNGGTNWTPTAGVISGGRLTKVRFNTSPVGWVAGQYGKVFKTLNNGGLTSVSFKESVPEKFSLSQNYPNPFNPITKIRFAIPLNVKREMSNVIIIIFDALGREIKTLLSEQLQTGIYEVTFDGSNLSSGIYFYKLTADEFSETKIMSLIK
jgi:photosystem II stability/assembly factor-like uncharacterized protein